MHTYRQCMHTRTPSPLPALPPALPPSPPPPPPTPCRAPMRLTWLSAWVWTPHATHTMAAAAPAWQQHSGRRRCRYWALRGVWRGVAVTDIYTHLGPCCGATRPHKIIALSKHCLTLIPSTLVRACWAGDNAVCEGCIVTWSRHMQLADRTARLTEHIVSVCTPQTNTHQMLHLLCS